LFRATKPTPRHKYAIIAPAWKSEFREFPKFFKSAANNSLRSSTSRGTFSRYHCGMSVKHVLPERLKPGLRLVFCGTAAGRQSALQKAYYAHGQNKFWRTLYAVGLTPRCFAPKEYPALWELDIGLTDIAKFASGMDHQLPKGSLGPGAVRALKARIVKAAPRHLAFTSLNAGRSVLGKSAIAGEQPERWGETKLWILPSPSPLAANHWDIAPWKALAKAVLSAR
jgi:TDG/mug DNA glycosylase family protein